LFLVDLVIKGEALGIQGDYSNGGWYQPVFLWYRGECMISIIIIYNGIKEPTLVFFFFNTSESIDIW
jgi:hypothetical protein